MLSLPKTYYIADEGTSPKFAAAFAEGCGGALCVALTESPTGPIAAFATPPTWPLFDAAIAAGYDYYYGDHAYWGRGRYYRIARNAVQFQPTADDLARATPDRFSQLGVTIVPEWRRSTPASPIIVCPNGIPYMARFGIDAGAWIADVEQTLRRYTDRPIISRWKADAKIRPLSVDLQTAHAVVVFSSNSALEAVCAGVPAFVLAPWASAGALASADLSAIETPYYPHNRERVCWSLAEHQWTLAEIASGLAWQSALDPDGRRLHNRTAAG